MIQTHRIIQIQVGGMSDIKLQPVSFLKTGQFALKRIAED
jgi:hypothetical protein